MAGARPASRVAAPDPDGFPYHAEAQGRLRAAAGRVFAFLDDHARLAAHMTRRSWRMGWSRMNLQFDEGAGQALGSRIRLEGRVLGVRLSLEEEVTEHTPPIRKVWATVGTPRLLVIGPYRMGFTLGAGDFAANDVGADQVTLTVFIDYALPARGLSWLLGRIVGHWYARWCTRRMVADTETAFATAVPAPPRSR